MLRKWLAMVVACLVLQASNLAVAAPQAAGTVRGVKEQVRVLPAGSPLELKLKNRDKLKGRLGSIYDEGFEIQVSRSGTITPVRVAFADVQSLRQKSGMSTGAKIGLGVGIFVGMAALVSYLVLSAIGRNG
jgi:hypothetical protein